MIPWEKVLTHAEAIRFAAAEDRLAALRLSGIVDRQDVARRLGVPVGDAPEPADLVKQLTPTNVTFSCSGIHREMKERCTWPAARLMFVGCVHEHISAAFLCVPHNAGWPDDDNSCYPCTLAGHACPLTELPGDKMPDAEAVLIEGLICEYTDEAEREVMWRFWQENLYRLIPERLRMAS